MDITIILICIIIGLLINIFISSNFEISKLKEKIKELEGGIINHKEAIEDSIGRINHIINNNIKSINDYLDIPYTIIKTNELKNSNILLEDIKKEEKYNV